MTTPTDAPEVDNVFTSLYFEKIHIPEFVHGSCELAEKEIQNESDSAKQYSQDLQNRIDKTISEKYGKEFKHVFIVLLKKLKFSFMQCKNILLN